MADTATKIPFAEAAAPSTPAAGKVVVYAKTDGLMYSKDDAGAETLMSSGGAGSVATDAIWDAAGDLVQGTGSNTAAKLGAGTAGQFLMSGGAATANSWASRELDYVEITSSVAPTATTEGTANTVVTANGIAFDGSTTIVIDFYCETLRPRIDGTAGSISLWLYDGASSIGRIALLSKSDAVAAGFGAPCFVSRRLTPSAATHTYSIRASVTGGTGSVSAGTGVITGVQPAFIRITRAV